MSLLHVFKVYRLLYLPPAKFFLNMDDIKNCGDGMTVHRYVDILSDAGFNAVFGDRSDPVRKDKYVSNY